MKRLIILALSVSLAACAPRTAQETASFVVNKNSSNGAAQAGGKSYALEAATLTTKVGWLTFKAGRQSPAIDFQVPLAGLLSANVGKDLKIDFGHVNLDGKLYELESGTLVVQTLQDGLARGNFNVRVKDQRPPWEVVGSFDVSLDP